MSPMILRLKGAVPLCGAAMLLLFMAGCLMVSACLGGRGPDPLSSPRFLTPVAEAQNAGVTTYWMGEEFEAGSLLFELNEVASSFPVGDDFAGISLQHAAEIGSGSVGFSLATYPSHANSGAEVTKARVEAVPGTVSEDVVVEGWQAELFSVPGAPRPVNRRYLFLYGDEMTVVGQVGSGSTGVPGEDVNPLLDSDLLIEVVAEHLRPFPE